MPPRNLHNPFRMSAVEIRILRYHLRFKPDAEFHTQIIDLPHQFRQAALNLILIDIPITQTGIVIIPLAEPAVIHHNHFDTHIFRCLCDFHQFDIVKLEEGRLPGVDQNRSVHISDKLTTVQISPEKVMVSVTHSGQAVLRVCHQHCRCVKTLPRADQVVKIHIINAHHQADLVILVELCLRGKAAGIHKGKSIA